jgi:hypothetical protein
MEKIIMDPGATLPVSFSWASKTKANDGSAGDDGWLQGAKLATSSWSITGDDTALQMVPDSSEIADIVNPSTAEIVSEDTKAVVWLTTPTAGAEYTVTNHIETDEDPPRIDERSIRIQARQR